MEKETLTIAYRNGTADCFKADQLDTSILTLRGHASQLIRSWAQGSTGIYMLDSYNAVYLSEIICVRIN
jgi:hypothetical protein